VRGREHRQRNREDNNGFCSGSGVGSEDDDNARSVRIILPHWLERVDQEDEEQFTRQQQEHEWQEDEARRRRTIELGRLRTPEPKGLAMTHSQEDIAHSSSLPSSGYSTVISKLYQQLTTLLTQLEPAAQSTISALISKVTSLESLIKSTQFSHPCLPPIPHHCLRQIPLQQPTFNRQPLPKPTACSPTLIPVGPCKQSP
jgi:hypothetical protein